MRKILDVTDKRVRSMQVICMAISGSLVGLSLALLPRGGASILPALLLGLPGLAIFILAASLRQRWEIEYRGHRIRFENSPVTAEKLYIDEGLVARGGVGAKMELRAPIRVGEGAGEEVMALADAGFLQVRLRIYIENEDPGSPAAASIIAPAPEVVQSAVIGKLVVAKQVIEFIASLIAVIGALAAGVLWLQR